MIIEIGGGEGGLKEYLEHGRKAGRELHRDELDQRVPLYGDLEVFEIATTYKGNGKKYDHVSLSFSENNVTDEMLQKTVDEFRDHALAAWPESERYRIAFYAEAHRPKILSYINSETGEEEKRYIHIHIGIGRRDLETGKSVEVLGYLGQESDNLKYIDAWQESFNARFGFSSPKDNPKITPENSADTIARYTGQKPDVFGSFNQQKSALEITLQKEIIEKNITTWNAFEKLLSAHGDVSKMHKGKFGECFRLKPFGSERAMRLEGQFFKRQFIERSTDAKIAIITDKAREVYLEQMQPKKAPEYTEPILKEWRETTAREIRFIHKSSPFYKTEYKPASTQKRKQLLNDLEISNHTETTFNLTQQQLLKGAEHVLRTSLDHGIPPDHILRAHSIKGKESGPVTQRSGSLHELPAGNLDADRQNADLLLPDAVQKRMGTMRSGQDTDLRRPGTGETGSRGAVNQPSSVLARVQSDLLNDYEQANAKEKYSEIRKKIDCKLLLDSLSHSHKINLKYYSATKAKDGIPRIQCGSRSLSPSDFLMKELGLSWREAAPVLRNTYELQIGKKTIRPREKVFTGNLWKEFKAERDAEYPQSKILEKLKIFDTAARAKKTLLAERLKAEQKAALADLSGSERKASMSLQKLRAATVKSDLDAILKDERLAYRDSIQMPQFVAWRAFLQARAQLGNNHALSALRKIDDTAHNSANITSGITGTLILNDEDDDALKRRRARKSNTSILKTLVHVIEKNGDITYSQHGRAVLRDEGQHLAVLDEHSEEAISAGLMIAKEKFGANLTLTGSDEFQRRVVAVAVDQGINVKFFDTNMEALRQQLVHKKYAPRVAAPAKPLIVPALAIGSSIAVNQQAEEELPAVDIPVPSIPAPLLPCSDWIATQSKPLVPVYQVSGDVEFSVVHVADFVVIDLGRTVAQLPIPTDMVLQPGMRVVIDKDGSFKIAPERYASELELNKMGGR